MRIGPAAHGVLLGAALIFAYQTWTRDKTEDLNVGDYVVWQGKEGAVEAIIYDTERKSVRIERRQDDDGDYLWGVVKRSRPNPKAAHPEIDTGSEGEETEAAEGEGEGDGEATEAAEGEEAAGDEAAGDGAEAAEAEEPEAEEPVEPAMITTTTEFPVGEAGQTVVDNFATLHALRDLGVLDDETKEKYGLHQSKDNLTVLFEGDTQRTLIVGKRVYGGSDRYVLDPENGKAYVISTELMRPIEGAENSLDLKSLHDFEDDAVANVAVKTAKGEKKLVKSEIEDEGGKKIAWAYAETPKEADLMLANFLDRASKLRPSEYDAELKAEDLIHLATFRFHGEDGAELGYLELYRQTPEMQPDEETDALGRRPGPKWTQYWLRTEKTRALGKASRIAAERVDNDLVELFGIEPPPPAPEPAPVPGTPPGAADPHGHGAAAAPHGGPANPHGSPANPHGGHGAPAGAPGADGTGAKKPAAKTPAAKEPATKKPAAKKPEPKTPAAKKPGVSKPATTPAP